MKVQGQVHVIFVEQRGDSSVDQQVVSSAALSFVSSSSASLTKTLGCGGWVDHQLHPFLKFDFFFHRSCSSPKQHLQLVHSLFIWHIIHSFVVFYGRI